MGQTEGHGRTELEPYLSGTWAVNVFPPPGTLTGQKGTTVADDVGSGERAIDKTQSVEPNPQIR